MLFSNLVFSRIRNYEINSMYKKTMMVIGIIFIIIFFFIFGTPKYQSMKIKSEDFSDFAIKIKEASKTYSEIDIKKFINFNWDECYVFPPYYPPERVYEKTGTEWTEYKTFIGFLLFHDIEHESVDDSDYLIVFKKDSKVVLSQITSSDELSVIFRLDNFKFASSNAKFLVRDAEQYEGEKIKELIQIN
ncbi:hypothetical protein [Petroclostridium sp. X23]|uniref:hypothetical protein n=1 Tax=Petroclostridium sp. X23 TaxID=3045146 RepID=UPI0024ADAD14|nr:hypothetical protein [Petroclostridium sp. X23]WHH58334.1 hypothetical protein QKW49_21420 [Petroclostridium sp. X23]